MDSNKIFVGHEINVKRQRELDVAKAILIISLAMIHTVIECSTEEMLWHGIPFFLDSVVGGPYAAPTFMFCMGACLVYARDQRPVTFFKRGISIFILGYVLNIFRYTIPFTIGYLWTGDKAFYYNKIFYMTFNNDIMQFAGLAFICLAIMLYLKMPHWAMLAISAALSIFGSIIRGIDFHNVGANIFFGLFIGTEDQTGDLHTYFVLFNWLIIVVGGYVFGNYLKRMQNKDKFYLIVTPPGFIITVIAIIYELKREIGMYGEGDLCYYHLLTIDAIICFCAILSFIGVCHFLGKILPEKIMYWVNDISNNINAVYCIHWPIVTMITDVILYKIRGTSVLDPLYSFPLSIVISFVAIMIAHYFKIAYKKRKNLAK